MSEFLPALAASDLPPGRAAEVKVGGQAVALFNVDGTFHALAARCPHRGGPLGSGFLEGLQVSCPWHGWTFDVSTGLNADGGGPGVPRFDVLVEGGQVCVKVG